MSQHKEQQTQDKLIKIKDKLPDGVIKQSVEEKLKYINKPIRK